MEIPVAKATYLNTQNLWKLFWQRADVEWHGYEPNLTIPSLKEFLAVVDVDECGCFWR
ncbi:MAG: DUF3024 domain-containing protein [Oceanospirillaceae bacterium]|nr:DUF3024 domain-containing protein [Oceanospirillaceae bacterium]